MKEKDFSLRENYEALSNEELESCLHAELEKDSVSGEKIREIMRILRQRDASDPQELPCDVASAIEKIQNESGAESPENRNCNHRHFSGLGKIAAVAAVIAIVMFGVPYAFGTGNIVELVAKWTDGTFKFLRPGETISTQPEYIFETDHPGLQEIYDTVSGLGVTEPVVPMWVPEGFELTELKVKKETESTVVYGRLENGNSMIVLWLSIHNDEIGRPLRAIKDEEDVEKLEIDEIVHYIIGNNDNLIATWSNGCVNCFISTNVTKRELVNMIKFTYSKG